MSSALVLLPLLIRTDDHAPLAAPSERALQWATLLTVTVVVFVPHDFPSTAFLLLPIGTMVRLASVAPVAAPPASIAGAAGASPRP